MSAGQHEYSDQELLDRNILFFIQSIRTGTPGKIVETDGTKATIQPLIKKLFNGEEKLPPVITDVPLWRLGTSTARVSLPLNPQGGDYCVINFCERPIDVWAMGDGSPKAPKDGDTHDTRGAWALIGLEPFQEEAVDLENLNIQMNRGTANESSIVLDNQGTIKITAPTSVVIETPLLTTTATTVTADSATAVDFSAALTFDLSATTSIPIGTVAAAALIIGGPLDHVHSNNAPAPGPTSTSAVVPAP